VNLKERKTSNRTGQRSKFSKVNQNCCVIYVSKPLKTSNIVFIVYPFIKTIPITSTEKTGFVVICVIRGYNHYFILASRKLRENLL